MPSKGLFIAALTLAACAAAPAAGETEAAARDCFRSAEVNGYNVIDRNRVRLSVGANRHYMLTTRWNTYYLDWTEVIALRTATGRVCTGNGLGVELIGGRPRRTYPIMSIERVSEEPPAAQGS